MNTKTASRLPRFELSDRPNPTPYDSALRYWVWSRTKPGVKYLVQLDSYDCNGECQCESFRFNFEKYLRRGITPEHAVAAKFVKLKEKQRPADAFRCPHILEAFLQFGIDAAKTISKNEKEQPY